MKKFLLFLTAGVLGTLLVLKTMDRKKDVLHFIEDDDRKNFGAFPPEIPEQQFDGLFV